MGGGGGSWQVVRGLGREGQGGMGCVMEDGGGGSGDRKMAKEEE